MSNSPSSPLYVGCLTVLRVDIPSMLVLLLFFSVNQSSQLPWKVFLSRGKGKKLPREGGVDSPEWRKFFKDVIKL